MRDASTLIELHSRRVIAGIGQRALSAYSRFVGLIGRREMLDDEALWIVDCNAIHTAFMRFPIDVAFLDADGCVVGLHESVRPWRIVVGSRKARHVVELAEGTIARTKIAPGERIALQ